MLYSDITAGNLSQIVTLNNAQNAAIRTMERGTVEPSVKVAGLLWQAIDYPSGPAVPTLQQWTGAAWELRAFMRGTWLNTYGDAVPVANLPMGGFVLTGLGAGSANGHSVRYEQVIRADGTNPLTANWDVGARKLTNLAAPTGAGDAARYDEVFAAGNGLLRYVIGTQLEQDGGSATSSQILGWTPRRVRVRLYGSVRLQSGGTLLGTIDQELEYHRWTGAAGPDNSFPGTEGEILLATVSVGGVDVNIHLEPRFSPADKLGFWIRVRRDSDDAYCNVEHVHTLSEFGRGQ